MSGASALWGDTHYVFMPSATRIAGGRALLLAFFVTTGLLAGCVDAQDNPTPAGAVADAVRPEGTEEWPVIEVVTRNGVWSPDHPGPWYDRPEGDLVAPSLILWINEDVAMHRMLVIVRAPQAAAPAAGGGDGHDHEHSHRTAGLPGVPVFDLSAPKGGDHSGGDHAHDGEVVIDVIVEPGESAYTPLVAPGLFDVHCHPHPWMVDGWTATSADASDQVVVVNEHHLVGVDEGVLEMGGARERNSSWTVAMPDLVRVTAVVAWDDAEDDVVDVEALNAPDRLYVELLGPEGQLLDEARETARSGNVSLTFETSTTPWPKTVRAADEAEAKAMIRGQRAPDLSWLGQWTVRITLEAANGLTVTDAMPVDQGPAADGKQSWNLEIVAVHQIGQAVPQGADTTPSAQVDDWAEPSAHQH